MREIPLVMPKMSMTMEEGTLVVWHKAVDDEVRVGDVVCEVATDKVDMEVESTADGILTRLVAEPDQVVPVGEPIAFVTTTADDLLEGLFDEPGAVSGTGRTSPASGETPVAVADPGLKTAQRAVPLARMRARALGVDLNSIEGTGPGGTVRVLDVEQAAITGSQPSKSAPSLDSTNRTASPGSIEVTQGKRRSTRVAVARTMTASAAVPQFTVYRELDLETLVPHRGRRTWTAVFAKAFAGVIREAPMLNAQWIDDDSRALESVAVALAVDTDRGLLAPVLTDPDRAGLDELDERIRSLVARARGGKLTVQEMSSPASTTISNLGGLGIDAFHALLTPPQATALSLGSIRPRLVPVMGGTAVRMSCTVGLTVDHRVADGADAARALEALQAVLNDLDRLVVG